MTQCSTEFELQQLYMGLIDQATEAGFLVPVTKFTGKHVPALQACFIESMINTCKEELNQFIRGRDLKLNDVLNLVLLLASRICNSFYSPVFR